MSNREFYQDTFSQVRSSTEIRWEDFQSMKRRKNPARRVLALAAAVCLLAVLSIAAAATGLFGLRDVLLPEKGSVYVTDENDVVVPGEYEYRDFVSLSGWQDTPESRALAEWRSFLEDYDRDGAIIGEIGNSPTGFEEDYGLYLVYTREMADKLEEIAAKYGLCLHTRMEDVMPEAWRTAAGDFCGENVMAYSGYIYENGTFRFDGEADLDGYGYIEYQFSRSVRGAFDDVALNIGDAADFQEWTYETADGTSVTLGLGAKNRSLILADLGDSFILVNVLTGKAGDDTFSSGPIGRAELEALADSFQFSALTPVRQPDFDAILAENAGYMEAMQGQPVPEEPEEDDPLYESTGIRTEAARDFVLLLAERIQDGKREEVANLLVYPAQVEVSAGTFTVNSAEEFLPYYDEVIGQNRLGLSTAMTWEPTPGEPRLYRDGSGLVSAADGAVWLGLVEESVLRIFTIQTDQAAVRAAAPPPGGDDIYDRTGIETDVAKAFVWDLAELLAEGEREKVADLFVYPCAARTGDGTFTVNTPEELLEYYDEALESHMGDLIPKLDYTTLFTRDGLVGVGDGAAWFGLVEDGEMRLFSLWSAQGLGVGPVVSEPTRG
ncbi:hypothetical protein [Oscillibacter sp.]|jgi:hypothetical protein|uniref:hypothetical protein n=1 Tax=Oscillibacter sp. TaxID=1945593 RepID=UPI0026282271|nr:hypothetical protein [Oscillibacter sp.]